MAIDHGLDIDDPRLRDDHGETEWALGAWRCTSDAPRYGGWPICARSAGSGGRWEIYGWIAGDEDHAPTIAQAADAIARARANYDA